MSIIKIEFPADDKVAAAAFATALRRIADERGAEADFEEFTRNVERDIASALELHKPTPAQGGAEEESPGKSADGADTSATETVASAENAEQTGAAPLDPKGVGFNDEYCGKATQPFYGSGPRSGQWKKRKGVDEAAYDAWYAAELAKVVPLEKPEPAPIDTTAAFSGGGGTKPEVVATDAPVDAGSFMGWVSEKQAMGALTQDMINAAWVESGVEMTDLFAASEADVRASIKKIYDVLSAKVIV